MYSLLLVGGAERVNWAVVLREVCKVLFCLYLQGVLSVNVKFSSSPYLTECQHRVIWVEMVLQWKHKPCVEQCKGGVAVLQHTLLKSQSWQKIRQVTDSAVT